MCFKLSVIISAYIVLIVAFSWLSPLVITPQYFSCRIQLLAISGDKGLIIPGEIRVIPGGTGAISSSDVSGDVLVSFKLALIYASITTGVNYKSYNYYLKISGDVKGLSATLLFYIVLSQMLGKGECPQGISATGIIGPGGVIGAISGLEQKLEAARGGNISLIYAPGVQQNTFNYTSINVKGVYTVYDIEPSWGRTGNSKLYQLFNYTQLLFKPVYENLSNTANAILSELSSLNWRDEYSKTARERLEESTVAADQGKYYVAASLAYSALVNAYISRLSCIYKLQSIRILGVVNETLFNVLSTASTIKSEIIQRLEEAVLSGSLDPVYLDLMITAYTRISEAERLAKQASNLRGDIEELISNTAVAQARVLSAYGWLSVANNTHSNINMSINISYTGFLSKLAREFLSIHLDYLSLLGLEWSSNVPETSSVTSLLEVFSVLLDASRVIYTSLNTVFTPTSREVVEALMESIRGVVENYTRLYGYVPISTLLVLDLAKYYLNIGVKPSEAIILVYSELPRVALYAYMAIVKEHEHALPWYLNLQVEVLAFIAMALLVSGVLLYYLKKRSRELGLPSSVIQESSLNGLML